MNKPSRNPRTLTRWILTEQRKHPNAKGDLSIVLNSISLAIKIISGSAQGAGIFHQLNAALETESLSEALAETNTHSTSTTNANTNTNTNAMESDDSDMKLNLNLEPSALSKKPSKSQSILLKKNRIDAYAEDVLKNSISWCGKVGLMASQKTAKPIRLVCEDPKYAIVFDPLDGSQNIEANVSVGSIFGILRMPDPQNVTEKDLLQAGEHLVCAGYALYGDATVIVMTFGTEVNGFTLDPTIGEFVMTHKNIRIPQKGSIYSVNEGNFEEWSEPVQQYVTNCKKSTAKQKAKKLRYIGSMVADVHRTLLYGGIFMYPISRKYPRGKLGLLYEVNPLCFIVETAGGKSSNGQQSPLTVVPKDIHDTSAVFVGSVEEVTALELMIKTAQTQQ